MTEKLEQYADSLYPKRGETGKLLANAFANSKKRGAFLAGFQLGAEFAEWICDNYIKDEIRGFYSKFHDGSHGKSHISPKFYTRSELIDLFLETKIKSNDSSK